MRKTLMIGLVWLAASGVALAQQQHGGGGDSSAGGRPPAGRSAPPPPPAPLPRCADLAPGIYAYVTEIPGGEPLGADEVALQWSVRNSGNAPYTASNANTQHLSLEYSSPAGVQEVATTPLPEQLEGQVSLQQGQSWRGYLRVHVTPEVRRRALRLRLSYAGDRDFRPNDCNLTNNAVVITGPPPPAS